MNLLKITNEAMEAANKYISFAPTPEVEMTYSASEGCDKATVVLYYMQVSKHSHGKIKNEFYHVNRALAISAVVAMMDVFRGYGVKCKADEFQEFSFGFCITVSPEIKDYEIHTKED